MSLAYKLVGSFNQSLLVIYLFICVSLFTLVLYSSMEQMNRRRSGWHLFAPVKELAALLSVNQVPWEIIYFVYHAYSDWSSK